MKKGDLVKIKKTHPFVSFPNELRRVEAGAVGIFAGFDKETNLSSIFVDGQISKWLKEIKRDYWEKL